MRSLQKKHRPTENYPVRIKSSTQYYCDIENSTETRSNSININLPGYIFIHKDSRPNAGEVGLYLKEDLQYKTLENINIDLENVENILIFSKFYFLDLDLLVFRYSIVYDQCLNRVRRDAKQSKL